MLLYVLLVILLNACVIQCQNVPSFVVLHIYPATIVPNGTAMSLYCDTSNADIATTTYNYTNPSLLFENNSTESGVTYTFFQDDDVVQESSDSGLQFFANSSNTGRYSCAISTGSRSPAISLSVRNDNCGPLQVRASCFERCTCSEMRAKGSCQKCQITLAGYQPCACIDGYFFDTTEQKCRPKEECSIDSNSVRQRPRVLTTTAAPSNTIPCRMELLPEPEPDCFYQHDYSRDGCISYTRLVCNQTCGANQLYKECGLPCPTTCDSIQNPHNCWQSCVAGCFCKEGYVLYNGECKERSICGEPSCPNNEHYVKCGQQCDNTCKRRGASETCPSNCTTGYCVCNDGYYRSGKGVCVMKYLCDEWPEYLG